VTECSAIDISAPISLQAPLSLFLFSIFSPLPQSDGIPPRTPPPDVHILTSFPPSTFVLDCFAAFDLFVPGSGLVPSGLDESMASGRDFPAETLHMLQCY